MSLNQQTSHKTEVKRVTNTFSVFFLISVSLLNYMYIYIENLCKNYIMCSLSEYILFIMFRFEVKWEKKQFS